MSAFTIPSIFTAVDKLTAPVRRMTGSVQSFAQKSEAGLSRLNRRLNSVTRGIGSMGLAIGGAFAGRFIFQQVADFETGLVGVGKTTGAAGKELNDLGASIVQLSKDLEVVSNEKLLEFSQSAGQLGISGSENILKFAETMAKLETASDVAGEEGASSIARLLTITGEGVGVVDRFASTLVELGNTSAATEQEILSVASEIGRATASFGVASQEVLGMSAAFKSLDVRPEAAGTAVGKAFRAIESAVNNGGSELAKFGEIMGVSNTEVQELFSKDKTATFAKFMSGLGGISNAGGSLSEALASVGLSGETVIKGLGPMATNSELLTEKLNAAAVAFEKNTALNEEFATASQTLNNALKSITIGFSNFLNTAINSKSTSGLGMVRDLLFSLGRNMDTVVTIIGTLVGAFLALKTIVLLGRGALIAYNLIANTVFLVNMIKYVAATQGLTFAQAALNVVMAANPIGLMIIAIVAVIAAVVLVITYWDEWGASIMALASIVGSFFLKFLGPIGLAISFVVSLYKNWQMVSDAFTNGGFIDGLLAIGKVILDVLLAPIQQLLEMIASITGIDVIGDFAKDIEGFRSELGLQTDMNANFNENTPSPLINNNQESALSLHKILGTQTNNVNLNVNDPDNRTTVDTRNAPGVKVGGTVGAI